MTEPVLQHTPLLRQWPHCDTALTVFRYALLREMCRGKRVLEIGAAAGEGTLLLADAARIVAIDHQDLWSGSPAASLPNVRFVQCDALDLPAEWEGQFDVVVALELIEHLADPAAFQQAVFRVLAEGGRVILSTPNFDVYSAVCDRTRAPLYCHHLREYRAAELNEALLDVWGTRQISGISQLSFSGEMAGSDGFVVLCGDRLYDLTLGTAYPHYALCPAGTLSSPLPLEVFQSFWVTLGKGTPSPEPQSDLPSVADSAALPPVTAAEAAFRSCQVILRRRNEHLRDVDPLLVDRIQHVGNLEGIIADRDRHIRNLEAIVADREARLAETEARLRTTIDRVVEVGKWPYRIAQRIRRVLRSPGAAAVGDGADRDESH